MTKKYHGEWSDTDLVTQVGWYAVLKCWDSEEGYFPDAGWWDGSAWRRAPNDPDRIPATLFIAGAPLSSYEAAEALAYEHDPDW